MPANDIEKQYNELRKKHTLPEFKEIDFEFEISDLEETSFLLRAVLRRIAERLESCTTILEDVLQPDTSNLYAMHEMRFFDDKEKKQMYELYTKLMSLNRMSIEASLARNENNEAEFVSNAYAEWKNLREGLLKFVGKMRASWKSEEADIKDDLGYLG